MTRPASRPVLPRSQVRPRPPSSPANPAPLLHDTSNSRRNIFRSAGQVTPCEAQHLPAIGDQPILSVAVPLELFRAYVVRLTVQLHHDPFRLEHDITHPDEGSARLVNRDIGHPAG